MSKIKLLRRRKVFLSASLPDELRGTRRAQDLDDLLVVLVGGILTSEATLVFGGHPTITPVVHRIAQDHSSAKPKLVLFQMLRFRDTAPEEIQDRNVFKSVRWVGREPANDRDIALDLREMRKKMARLSDAAVFVGGRTSDNVGGRPGIRDEFEVFKALRPDAPTYVLGCLGGECKNMIRDGGDDPIDNNKLTDAEREALHANDDVDLVASLVLADLRRHLS